MTEEQLLGMRLCQEDIHFVGLSVFKRAERMMKMNLSVDDRK